MISLSRKGVPNKNKTFLLNRLKDIYGDDFSPVLKMAEQAQNLHELALNSSQPTIIKASIEAWDKVASYVEPKVRPAQIEPEYDSFPTEIIIRGVASSN